MQTRTVHALKAVLDTLGLDASPFPLYKARLPALPPREPRCPQCKERLNGYIARPKQACKL
jgi:hypothetical protein